MMLREGAPYCDREKDAHFYMALSLYSECFVNDL